MVDIYRNYRSEAVDRYLLGDNYTLERNNIFYSIGDRDLVPKNFYYTDFSFGGKFQKKFGTLFLKSNLPSKRWNM